MPAPQVTLEELAEEAQQQGFDDSYVDPEEETVVIRCSQCVAVTINGNPVHEFSCPHKRK